MLTFYGYAKCSTCVNAKKFLATLGQTIREVDITTSPPSASALRGLIAKSGRPYTDFLNRSGLQYRALEMKEKVKTLPEETIVKFLASEGRLITADRHRRDAGDRGFFSGRFQESLGAVR